MNGWPDKKSLTRGSLFQLLITQTWFIRSIASLFLCSLCGNSLQIISYYTTITDWSTAPTWLPVFLLLIRLFLFIVGHAKCGNLPNDFPLILNSKPAESTRWSSVLEKSRAVCGGECQLRFDESQSNLNILSSVSNDSYRGSNLINAKCCFFLLCMEPLTFAW